MARDDPFDLERFVVAQGPVFDRVAAELKQGRKTSHWMWFVFPQIVGLGFSAMSRRYAISSLDEARAYLAHPMLGSRLRQCVAMLLDVKGRSAHEILGSPDDIKLHSSLTLFAQAAKDETLFDEALARFFEGRPDRSTLDRI
jgi:uncharacterized protein (DUF1810 family)